MFATYSFNNSKGYDTRLPVLSTFVLSGIQSADKRIEFMELLFDVNGKCSRNITPVIGDKCETNWRIAKKCSMYTVCIYLDAAATDLIERLLRCSNHAV